MTPIRTGALWALAIALSFAMAGLSFAQTVTKTISAQPVTTYDDGISIPASIAVTYDLEHRPCGQTAWTVITGASGLTAPSSARSIDAQCHEYAYVAIAQGIRSLESLPLRLDYTPLKRPATPSQPQAQ